LGGVTYAEGTDVDTYTYNGTGRDTFLLNKTGTYTFTGHIASPADGTDMIPIEIPTGGYINSYTLAISDVEINSSTQFNISNGTGTLVRNTALTNQTVTDDLPADSLYSFLLGNGTVVLDYTLTLDVVGPPSSPTATVV